MWPLAMWQVPRQAPQQLLPTAQVLAGQLVPCKGWMMTMMMRMRSRRRRERVGSEGAGGPGGQGMS
jgi:hypothetical protein